MSNQDNTSELQTLDISQLSDDHLKILLGPKADLRELLTLLQSNDQLENLLQKSIIQSSRQKDGFGDDKEACKEWRRHRWGNRLEETFLDRRRDLDQVTFWMVVYPTKGEAMEIFYQLCNNESNFEDLSLTNRRIKLHRCKRYNTLTAALQKRLRGAGISKPQTPTKTQNGFLITQVVEQIPAQLDEKMSKQLLLDLENNWAKRELQLRLEDLKFQQLSLNSTRLNTPS